MRSTAQLVTKAAGSAFAALLVFASAPSYAALDVANSPLFLTVSVPPNIVVTLDDSGSMARAFVPDTCGATSNDCGTLDNRYAKSSHFNPLYYNPNVKYAPAKQANGTNRTTSFSAAYRNGFDTGFGSVVDLRTSYRPTAFLTLNPGNQTASEGYMNHYSADMTCRTTTPRQCMIGSTATTKSCNSNNDCRNDDGFGVPAYYYVFNASNANCNGQANDNDCYTMVMVSSTSGPGGTDERENFANWYSFARTRNLATQTAASLAFATVPSTVRVGWQALNTCRNSATNFVDTDCDGYKNNFTNYSNAIRRFTGGHKNRFYEWLGQLPTNDTTPLPAAMRRAGEYFTRSGDGNPYDNDFTRAGGGELACRRNYHVMMTDGIWNEVQTIPDLENRDGTAIDPLPAVSSDSIGTYSPRAPFRDTYSNTLADWAFYYWARDLRGTTPAPNTALANTLLRNYRDSTGTPEQNFWNPRNNPATWQHMVNFTIGLGLTGYLSAENLTWNGDMYGGSYTALANGTRSWPEPGSNRSANVADLWHAAINSRGQFFSADDPTSLATAFQSALTAITAANGSSAALSANSTTLSGSTMIYQAKFQDDWSGTLLAYPVLAGGRVSPTSAWDAQTRIPAVDDRNIFTFNGTSGVELTSCSVLSTDQQTLLNHSGAGVRDDRCEARVGWLRGSATNEVRNGGTLRNRPTTVMGDIVNSDPAFVKGVNFGYAALDPTLGGGTTYSDYVAANNATTGRMAMVYVGANDGHLHGIRGDAGQTDSGQEKFSYIPAGVYHNLSHLTDPSYTHRYFVDGSIAVRDAYLNGAWRTILVAGLNAGGRSVYALDVTDPANFNEKNVLWEYSDTVDEPDADLGMTFSRPQIGILEDNTWVAVFGNGYNSANGGAYLYIVNLETGELIEKIEADDVDSSDESNGLSTPILVDTDDDTKIDVAYAGDLLGNLWKFDLTARTRLKLFASTGQPITSQPKVTNHHLGGHLIVFGTGRYLTDDDVFDTNRQSFYGIWDNGDGVTIGRSDLQVQSFDRVAVVSGRNVRSVTSTPVDWLEASNPSGRRGWYLDLLNGTGTGAGTIGERVVHTSVIVSSKTPRVIFGSIIPSVDPCKPGGTSWLIELNLFNGGGFDKTILDLNGDGVFDEDDSRSDTNNDGRIDDNDDPVDPDDLVSAVSNDELGISNTPLLIEDTPDLLYKTRTGTTGVISTEVNCKDCEPPEPPEPPTVSSPTRRSWIQIR